MRLISSSYIFTHIGGEAVGIHEIVRIGRLDLSDAATGNQDGVDSAGIRGFAFAVREVGFAGVVILRTSTASLSKSSVRM